MTYRDVVILVVVVRYSTTVRVLITREWEDKLRVVGVLERS